MAEDFFIKFATASYFEEETHYLLAEPYERVQALIPLLSQLVQSDSKPAEFHTCPVCRQALEVSFSRYPRTSETIGIETYCRTCNILVLFRSNKIPAWITEYGSLLEKIKKTEY